MAAAMGVGLIATLWGREPALVAPPPRTLRQAVVEPLREFFSRPGAWAMLALIILYKLGDAFAVSLSTAFLIRGGGFSPDDVAYVNKGVALAATIVGALFGGALMTRLRRLPAARSKRRSRPLHRRGRRRGPAHAGSPGPERDPRARLSHSF